MIDRRSFTWMMAAGASFGWNARCWAADNDKGLFWRLDVPGKGTAVVFGAWMIAGSVVPEIVRDGRVFVELTQRTIGAYPDFTFPKVDLDRKNIKPLHTIVSRGLAEEVRVIVEAATGMSSGQFDTMPAAMIPMLLITEGQTRMPPAVPVGLMIRAYAQQLQRPFSFLLSESEVKAAMGPPDLAAAATAVNESLIMYLIELRRQRGPLGRYVERLYAGRDSEGLQSFNDGVHEHGQVMMGFSESAVLSLRKVILERMLQAIGSQPGMSFFNLELVSLTGANGLFAALRRQGATIRALA